MTAGTPTCAQCSSTTDVAWTGLSVLCSVCDPDRVPAAVAARNGSGAATEHGPLRARGVDLSRVRPTRWAWERRLPIGYLALLIGAEGVGKGTLLAHVVALLTRGLLPGDLDGQPAKVLFVGDEDSFDAVVVPRLYAAGADVTLVRTIEDRYLDVTRDASDLATLIADEHIAAVIFDQLLDNLDSAVDDWRSKAIRDALRPLRRVAREQDVAILAALHPNKGQKASFRDLISGTHAFNALSRSSLLLAEDPEDGARRVLVRGKGNLSAPPRSYEFTLAPRTLELNGHTFEQPMVQDPVEGDLTTDDLLGRRSPETPIRDQVIEKLDAIGTGQPQRQADLARAAGREPDDSTVRAALRELEQDGRWAREGKQWRKTR